MAKQKFQLRPKHLITTILAVCVLAIIALIIGVVGTFKPRDEERRQEEQVQKQQREANRVEVWKPDGSSQETVILNPDAVNTARTPTGGQNKADRDRQAADNPFINSEPSHSRTEPLATQEVPRRARPRSDGNRIRPIETPQTQPAPSFPSPAVTPTPPSPAEPATPTQPRSEAKPAPQPKPQHKDVIDNLF
ncbi:MULTISPECIES: hypothetical protein [Neisseria]|uniref:Uncharacterized protein n=1 Tax=Neisseria brasiliensis TaxID=2666100 RepID=A0A7X2GXQ0_9NEIS|nr:MULTISPECIES: hypothetical protein [Neisseria]MRN37916.1 hypothetical protein [Neisseria brasiliensis]